MTRRGIEIAAALPAAVLSLLPCATPAAAQATTAPSTIAPAPEFEARARELVALLGGKGDYAALFTPTFIAQVPKAQFDAITAQLLAANGPVVGIERHHMASPYRGQLDLRLRDALIAVQLAVDPAPPHQIAGLLIQGAIASEKSLDEVAAALRGLHGATGFVLAKLGAGAPEMLLRHNSDQAFAVGSAFKLAILAELVRATNAGERKWTDLVTLDGTQLPGGAYVASPKGTQISLRELAGKMISVSDNSATDILLRALGREKVEAMLPVLGVHDPTRNRPFLGTLEAFKLKYLDHGSYARRYLALDEAGRRAMLAGELARIPLVAVPPPPPGGPQPAMIGDIEWFLSPADLVRVMDWLRRNTEGPAGGEARAILSTNPGIGMAASKWQWVGYKGGSEPGVINMTLLLQSKAGDWYVLAASWNDTQRAIEDGRFASLITRAAELAAGR
ncbi:MAG: serine hydrolase [Sphingomonas sp.]|uniref:serine hydrolase n=1 Tax=Sphingomonas sp. TaxID=28214 RepID=UPI001B1BD31E|nr:serine hydrolase [Sphingomonas sp.]MBO9621331.1 serine hydrolase [Sphingomonas sp.]